MLTINGIRFDGLHSYYDFGMWLSARPDYGNPQAKTNIAEVPGMDGDLDMTEANAGEVKFTNRIMTFVFAKMVDIDDQADWMASVRAALHGKRIKEIIADENPEWYYTGRATVAFSKVATWKMLCTVTVDAQPYSMKVNETRVDLNQSGTPSMEDILIASEDVSGQSWNSDLRLGTKTFPNGLGVPNGAYPNLIVKWPTNATTITNWARKLQIADSDDNVYNSTLQVPISSGEVMVPVSSIMAAGVDTTKVYRVLVQNIGGCSLHAEMLAFRYRIWNERKTVIPSIIFQSEEEYETSLQITLNGENRTIKNTETTYEDIVLKEGWNDLIIPYDTGVTVTAFYMVFREGRL